MLDTATLSRIQFAFTMTAHIVYPSISIGLVTYIAILEGRYLLSKNPAHLSACKYWSKMFALTFGMGVVSGIVMEFQFGTNWGGFSYKAGPLLGVLFTYEVLSAFFIEAGFLGIMLFGWNKVSKLTHFASTVLVALGTTLSAFWIMSANSWMQTPSGYFINDRGQFVTHDFWQVVFNPSFLPRFTHMLFSCYLSAAMLIMAICAYYMYQKRHLTFARNNFRMALIAAATIIPMQLVVGHDVGKLMLTHQPIKIAAMEGIWRSGPAQPTLLFAWPDQAHEYNRFEIGIPKLASYLLKDDWNAYLPGLDSVPKHERPWVLPVFWSFRIMVGCGLMMFAITYGAILLRLTTGSFEHPWFLVLSMLSAPLGVIALEMGWMSAEIGRQPWIIYKLLRTQDAISQVQASHVLTTLILLVIVYAIVFGYFYFRYLWLFIKQGPNEPEHQHHEFSPFHYMSTFDDNPSDNTPNPQ